MTTGSKPGEIPVKQPSHHPGDLSPDDLFNEEQNNEEDDDDEEEGGVSLV